MEFVFWNLYGMLWQVGISFNLRNPVKCFFNSTYSGIIVPIGLPVLSSEVHGTDFFVRMHWGSQSY
jgi:hypothetical protein